MLAYNVCSAEFNGEHSYLIEYWQKCHNGEIVVGCELLTELDNLIEMLGDKLYTFDLAPAHKRIRFIETKCKLFEAPFAGQPFILMLFQKAFVEAMYGFYIFDEEWNELVCYFQQAILLIGRKNGKTPFMAALALAEFFCGETGIKIMCASNDYDQADLCFQAIDAMREESQSLNNVSRKNIKGIFFGNPKQKKKKGKFSKQNKACIKKMSAKQGAKEGRNLGMVIVDEVFEMQDNSLVMPLRQALSTQKSPHYFEISTEGFTDGGYLDERLIEVRQMLKGEIPRSRILIWLYTQDNENEIWQNEKSWSKSNPGIGIIKKLSYMRGLVEEARESRSKRAYVLAKDFNIKQNNAQSWLEDSVILNISTFDFNRFRGQFYLGSADLSETTDLTSVKAAFIAKEKEIWKKYVLQMYFVPEAKADSQLFENDTNPEKKDYREWEKQGLVVICPGNEVEHETVANWFIKLFEEYEMKPLKIGYDNWHAKTFKKTIEDFFGENIPQRIPMDFNALSAPMRSLEADLKSKYINYNNNEIDRWNLKNTSIRTDNIGRIMPVKLQNNSKLRIDGTITFIICQLLYQQYGKQLKELM